MELNPQQSYKSVLEMHDRLITYRQLEAEVVNLREQLSATQAREARLVETVKSVMPTIKQNRHAPVVQILEQALSNSTEHAEKWLAEHDAKVLGNAANRFRNENYTLLPSTIECAETLETWANELREVK